MIRAPQLVRARPKAVEYLPEWAKCCAKAQIVRDELGEIFIDLATAREEKESSCKYCGASLPSWKSAKIVGGEFAGFLCPFEYLDLDETGVANGNYVEGPVIHE